MISITSDLLEGIFAHARSEAPDEVCGWLAGRDGEIEETYPVPNASERPKTRFVMEPEAQLSTMREIRELGLELVGTYHSHPKSPARPSGRDRELALYPGLAHLIVSLSDADVRCFRITETGISEVAVERSGGLL